MRDLTVTERGGGKRGGVERRTAWSDGMVLMGWKGAGAQGEGNLHESFPLVKIPSFCFSQVAMKISSRER